MPGPNDILIRVRATTVSSADWRIRSLTVPRGFGFMSRLVFGISAPRKQVLGTELAGDIVSVGTAVRNFAVGDAVIAFLGATLGAHAEYCCIKADSLVVKKPEALSWRTAAALAFGGTTALDFFRRARLREGEKVLINGGSGAVGSAMLQIAVAFGAEVTVVCSGANRECVQKLGARRVVDYTSSDFVSEGLRYNVIVDTVGNAPYSRVREALTPDGRLLLVVATLPQLLHAHWVDLTTKHRVYAGPVTERLDDLHTLVEMAAAGQFTPLIDCCLPLKLIAAAHARVESGMKRGSVVVEI
jgi:NADPH:quinone reductase-like Zn-dependent oxidoreductase